MKRLLLVLLLAVAARAQVSVPWTDVDKTGAAPADVGAQPLNANLTALAALGQSAFGRSILSLAQTNNAIVRTDGAGNYLLDTQLPLSLIPALSGDVTKTLGGSTLTLATVNANVGTFGGAANAVTLTIDGKGRITAASQIASTPAWSSVTGKPTLGTAAALNIPASGDAATGEVVKGSDTRLTDARTPTAHTHTASQISDSTTVGRAVITATDAAAGRAAIGAGTSSFDGTWSSLSGKPTVSTTSAANAIPQAGSDGKISAGFIPTDGWEFVLQHGTDAERLATTPNLAVPVFTTDTKQLYIGDGVTAGGIAVGSGSGGAAVSNIRYFGDGSDGALSLDGTVAAPSGMSKLGTVYWMTRDVYASSLTITGSTTVLDTNGFRLFVSGTLDLSSAPAGAIVSGYAIDTDIASTLDSTNDGDGGAAGGAGAWLFTVAAHQAYAGQTLGTMNPGGRGGAGLATASVNDSLMVPGQSGGLGSYSTDWPTAPLWLGTPSNANYAAAKGGDGSGYTGYTLSSGVAPTWTHPPAYATTELLWRGKTLEGGYPGHGGPGGAGDGTKKGGGGGAGGFGGGVLFISARVINRSSSNPAGVISAPGGRAGNGGAGDPAGNTGGGAGGQGGGGGLTWIIYRTLLGTTATNFVSAPGGNGGTGGAAGGTGTAGTGGGGGHSGQIVIFDLTADTCTVVSGTTGGNFSGTTGGTGAACNASL